MSFGAAFSRIVGLPKERMKEFYRTDRVAIYHGDARDVSEGLTGVDSCVCDPPYGIKFCGLKWDYDVPSVKTWEAVHDALKPGAHLLAFAGTRTQHRMCGRIEDAGFQIRDMLAWLYGSGCPKGVNVSRAIDRELGAEREIVGLKDRHGTHGKRKKKSWFSTAQQYVTASATDEARLWEGFATDLKPALEPITLARRRLVRGVAANVLRHGCGALNIDACRISGSDGVSRYPANLMHDGSEEVLDLFPKGKEGSAARYFYCAKSSPKDRGENNDHPTVKPLALMRHLCRLVTPPDGLIYDPFMGSGSTGVAAVLEGFRFVGCDIDEHNCAIAVARIQSAARLYPTLFKT